MLWLRSPSSWSRIIVALAFIVADSRYAMWTLALCPVAYWDRPSRRCAEPMVVALQLQQQASHVDVGQHHHRTQSLPPPPGGTPAELRNNSKTCLSWERTNTCYQQLIRECIYDHTAVYVLKAHIRRYYVYSQPCHERSQRNQQLADCFLTYFTPTQTCSEAFDRYYRSFVVDKQFSNACRVVISALRCFHDLTSKVAVGRCGSDGAAEYQRNYIRPLVEQSRETVTARCTLPSPYDQDFASGARPIGGTRRPSQHPNSATPWSLTCAAILFVVQHAPILAAPFLLTWAMLVPRLPPPTLPTVTSTTATRRRRPKVDDVDSQTTPGGVGVDGGSRARTLLRSCATDVCRNSCT